MNTSHARVALIACLCVLGSGRVDAQWAISAGVRASRFTGGAEEPATGRTLSPYRPTLVEVGLDRAWRHVGVGVRFGYASSSLALEGDEALAAVKDALSVYSAEPELTVRLTHLGADGVLRAYTGALIESWKLPDAGSRTRVGVAAGLGLEMSFGGRWTGVLRAGGAVTPSPFTQEDLDAALEPRTLWRRELGGSLRYRL